MFLLSYCRVNCKSQGGCSGAKPTISAYPVGFAPLHPPYDLRQFIFDWTEHYTFKIDVNVQTFYFFVEIDTFNIPWGVIPNAASNSPLLSIDTLFFLCKCVLQMTHITKPLLTQYGEEPVFLPRTASRIVARMSITGDWRLPSKRRSTRNNLF